MTFERQVIAYKRYFLDFCEDQEETVQRKIEWTLNLIRITQQVPKKYFQHMTTTKGLYEIRVEVGNNIFRIFSFFDTGNLIVLLMVFRKNLKRHPNKKLKKHLK